MKCKKIPGSTLIYISFKKEERKRERERERENILFYFILFIVFKK